MQQIDQGIESKELLLAEIDTLMRRFRYTQDGDMTELEKLFAKHRVECSVEKHCH